MLRQNHQKSDYMETKNKVRAPRNRTITLDENDRVRLRKKIISKENDQKISLINQVVNGNFNYYLKNIEDKSVDLLILDPPYNLDKNFNGFKFASRSFEAYTQYLREIFGALKSKLKDTATIYICGDWKTSVSIYDAAIDYFIVRNRITWEREKGRGALTNWKNCSEDIWFCTLSDDYIFNLEDVMLRRKVIAPYKDVFGNPKDWTEGKTGNFRDTSPSNFWSDITIPFWSMPENTDHPTQKSEKLIAKLILASSTKDSVVLDPFLGSGTTAVVSKKLGRNYIGFDINEEYCLLAARRLEIADSEQSIQGYANGVFWDRNTLNLQRESNSEKVVKTKKNTDEKGFFD